MSPSRKGSQRSSHAKRAGKDLESVTSEFVCVSLPLPLLLRKVFCSIFFFFSGQKDKVPLIQGVASSPPYWHFFSTETHLPPPTKFHRIKVLFSTTCKCTWQRHWPAKLLLPELSSGCYKTGNAQAMGLGGPWAKPSNPRTCPSLWSESPGWAGGRGVWLKLQPLKSPGLSIPVSCKIKRSEIPANQSTKAFGQWLIIANQSPSALPAHEGILTGNLCHSWTSQSW